MWNLGWLADVAKVLGGATAGIAVMAYLGKTLIDHRLETAVARYKGDLDREAERLRFELQREMLKAQLGTNRVYEIAPKLLVKVKKAYGAVSSVMGLSFAPDWREYDRQDLERAFENRDIFPVPLLSRQRQNLLENWGSDSLGLAREAREEVSTLYFRQQVGKARMLALRAHNYAVLYAVFLPADLAKFATDTTSELLGVNIDAEMTLVRHHGDGLKAHERLEAFAARGDELERRIRSVLAPTAAAMEVANAIRPGS
jgi:hypothetical protein